MSSKTSSTASTVALLAEGVDRNKGAMADGLDAGQSPSSRRAWIEIFFKKDGAT